MKSFIIRSFIVILSIGLSCTIPFYFHDLVAFGVLKIGIGWVMSTLLIRILVIFFFVIGLNTILKLIRRGKRTKSWIPIFGGMILGFLTSFAIEPIYDIDYFMLGDTLEITQFEDLSESTTNTYVRKDRYEVLAFFDVGCDHCQQASKKLGMNIAAGQAIPVHAFFANDTADVVHFLNINGGNSFETHYLPSESVFVRFAGFEFPSIFLVDPQGKTAYHWIGERMNYTALDYLLSLEQ